LTTYIIDCIIASNVYVYILERIIKYMNYSVSKESIRGKAISDYKAQWVKDEATLELFKTNIAQFNQRTNFLVIHLINELRIELEKESEKNQDKIKFLNDIRNHLETKEKEHSPIDIDLLQKFQHITELKSIIALMNNRNNFCAIYQKVLNYIEKGSQEPGSITINNISAVIAAYSKATSAQSFMDMVSYYPAAVKDFTSFLNEIEDRSKFMAEFVSKSPLHHRSYEILNEMNSRIFWNKILKGMTDIYRDKATTNTVIDKIYATNIFETQMDEKEFFINVIELIELNPKLDLKIFTPYVASLLGEEDVNPNNPVIKRYFDNTLQPFVKYIKRKNIKNLKEDIIRNIEKKIESKEFIKDFRLTNLDLLDKKVKIILKRTDPEIPGLDSDDYAYNYFLQDKAPWLPNHVSQAKSALITKRLQRHHELAELKSHLAEIKSRIINNPNANLERRRKINQLYREVILREKESLENLYAQEVEGIKYILSIDLNDCKGFELPHALCDDLLAVISKKNLTKQRSVILNKLDLLASDIKYKIQQSEGLFFNDPHLTNLKSMHNSVENLTRYLKNDYSLESCKELYTDLPIESLPYGRYIHQKNNERRKKNWEEQHSKMTEELQAGCQDYTNYLVKMNGLLSGNSNDNIAIQESSAQFEKILEEIKDKEDVSIEQLYDKFSNSTNDHMQLMLMYSAAKMQLFSNKLFDVLKVAKENDDLSTASQPLAFFVKYGEHKLFNNPFGMLYNFYISYRMNNYSKFLTDFSNQDPDRYRMYEIINHHASSSAITRFTLKSFNIYRKDFMNFVKRENVAKSLTDIIIKLVDGTIPNNLSSDPKTKYNLVTALDKYLPKKAHDPLIKYVLGLFDSLPRVRDEIISRIIPFYIKYGSLESINFEEAKNDIVTMLDNFFDSLGSGDDILSLISEDEIINHIIELQDLSKKTGVLVTSSMIKEILAQYNSCYSDPTSKEYQAFDNIFAHKGLNIQNVTNEYVAKHSLLFKLAKFNNVSSLLDNNKIQQVLSIMDSPNPDFRNVGENRSLRDINLDIPGDTNKAKKTFLIDILKRRASITSENLNKYSTSIDPAAPAFNYFSQENMTFLPCRYLNVISADLAKRLKKHVEILEDIEHIDHMLCLQNLSKDERKDLSEIKNKLLLTKEEYLGLILQDEFIGINRIFEKINDSELDDIKQEALEIERLLKLFLESKNNEIGDLDEIISRTINNFNNEKLLEKVKAANDINFIQNFKIDGILTSFNLMKEYFDACNNFNIDKDLNRNFEFLNNRSTIDKSDYKIQLTMMEYIKSLYYNLQMFVIKTASFIIYNAYNIVINKIIVPLLGYIADILNYPVLVGHYDTVKEDPKLVVCNDIDNELSDESTESELDALDAELEALDLEELEIKKLINDKIAEDSLNSPGVLSWCWFSAYSAAASTVSSVNQKFFGTKKQRA